jgi:Na+/phosphate symporter
MELMKDSLAPVKSDPGFIQFFTRFDTANAHTLFNVINAVIFIVFLPQLIKLTLLLSPSLSKLSDES